jgi:4-hydroxy-2-oxoheptanedioate aldolase
MRRSKVLAKLRSGSFVRVCAMLNPLPFFIRHAAEQGFDALWIDLEHGSYTPEEVKTVLTYCHLADIDAMIRPPTHQHVGLYRYLEDGASGLMIPMVPDAETARKIVKSTKFPPLGDRGFGGGLSLDADFMLAAPDNSFLERANHETFLVAQIETPTGLANAEEIAQVEGIDILFVGPRDLELRLTPNDPSLEEAIASVAEIVKRHGKSWGITAASFEQLTQRRNQGAQFVPSGSDAALIKLLATWRQELDSIGA